VPFAVAILNAKSLVIDECGAALQFRRPIRGAEAPRYVRRRDAT
jgi:hypothetical protein